MSSAVLQPQTGRLSLSAVSGPSTVSFQLREPGPITIGRLPDRDLYLNDRRVSREHAVLTFLTMPHAGEKLATLGQWFIADTGSRHGTWLNGRQLPAGGRHPLHPGDFLVIGPWTLSVIDGEVTPVSKFMTATFDDSGTAGSFVSRLDMDSAAVLERQRLGLLLDCADEIHACQDRQSLAEAVLHAAASGTGFVNGAFLGPLSPDGRIDVLASRGMIATSDNAPRISRSLIREAGAGIPARLVGGLDPVNHAHSIVQLGIREALCVPIMLGGAVTGFIYLDNRSDAGEHTAIVADAATFIIGLARLAAMALSNLMRVEIQRRSARMDAELSAAAESQRCLMPPRAGHWGPFGYAGRSRPGQYVGGDLFDIIPLENDRLAIAAGDVTGKGIPASVLMATAKGFLYGALEDHGDPGRAVCELSRFIQPRLPEERFLSLWVGVLDGRTRTLRYVDAGHGYALLMVDGRFERLNENRQTVIGAVADIQYEAATRELPPEGRVIVVTDGLIEQTDGVPDGHPHPDDPTGRAQFGLTGVQRCLGDLAPGQNEIDALFAAVEKYAGTNMLADDATAVVVRWPDPGVKSA